MEVLYLDFCFVIFIYLLVPFRAGFFSSLKEFFLLVCFTGKLQFSKVIFNFLLNNYFYILIY